VVTILLGCWLAVGCLVVGVAVMVSAGLRVDLLVALVIVFLIKRPFYNGNKGIFAGCCGGCLSAPCASFVVG